MEKLYRNCIILAFLVSLFLLLEGCTPEAQSQNAVVIKPVKTMVVTGEDVASTRTFPGAVVAGEKAEVGFRVGGQLIEFVVKEGQEVKEGQVIARLDSSDYLTTVRDLESQLEGARASMKEAHLNFKRNAVLLKKDIISKATYDNAQSTYENAAAQVESLEQKLKQARLNVTYTTLKAPFSGIVAQTYVKNYENIQAQQNILRIDDTKNLDVEVEVPERIIAIIRTKSSKVGKPYVRFAAQPEVLYEAKFKEYQAAANSQTRTYTVTFTLPQPEGLNIYSGMTAEVVSTYPSGSSTGVRIPVTAVAADEDGKPFVWVVQEDKTVKRFSVELGELEKEDYVLKSGLENGMQVVTAGVHYLNPGQAVRVLTSGVGE